MGQSNIPLKFPIGDDAQECSVRFLARRVINSCLSEIEILLSRHMFSNIRNARNVLHALHAFIPYVQWTDWELGNSTKKNTGI
jgi:hypothetical protein